MSSTTTNYNFHKIDLSDAPPDITVLNENFDVIDNELNDLKSNKANSNTVTDHINDKSNPHDVTAEQIDALPLTGGVLSGALTVMDNFNVNKTYDNVEYKTYVRPLNYELGGEYTTGLIHYNNNVNDSQLLFNKNGVAFRDNVNSKLYQLFGQHNAATARSNMGLGNTTGALPIANGGTGSTSASAALTALGGQSTMAFATASTVTAGTAGAIDIPLSTFIEQDSAGVFSSGRYSSSYGYGIKCAKAGKYLIMAHANLSIPKGSSDYAPVLAIRKVVSGTSSYIAKCMLNQEANSGAERSCCATIVPFVAELAANSYLSLYLATSGVKTNSNGCHLTAVYLGA